MKPYVQAPTSKTTVIWQELEEDIPEPAIMLHEYETTFSIMQRDSSIEVNYETIPELIKQLKLIKAQRLS